MGGVKDAWDDLRGATAADAAEQASAQIQANINRGMDLAEAQQGQFRQDLLEGQTRGQIDLSRALNQLRQSQGEQQGFLGQAQGLFGDTAAMTAPALSNLQQTGTAAGRAQAMQDIMADPNQAALFDESARQTQNRLSGLGLGRRSGFGIGQTEQGQLDLANQLLSQQDASQQNLANIGLGAQGNLANILGQRSNVAGAGGSNLANILGQSAQFKQQGGVNLSMLGQQGLANQLNLLGQLGQAQAAGTMGAANAMQQGTGNVLNAGGQILGGLLASDRRLKENIKKVGKLDSGLSVYTYNYKGDNTPQMGVMAQEARELFPDAVLETDTGFLAVNYGGIA